MSQPTIETHRLILRPLRASDAEVVQRLAGDREIADTTLNIPHPYEDGMAKAWIESQGPGIEDGSLATFAMVLRDDARLTGVMGLKIDRAFNKGELGYWVGKPYWGLGYATEAAVAVLAFGFEALALNRIHAGHFARNPASGRVMQKAGMVLEGTLRQDVIKWGEYEDIVIYGVLRDDWTRA